MTDVVMPADTLAAAELRAALARERLQTTLGQLQNRLDPRERVRDVAREARLVGETAAAIVRDKPVATGGVVAGAAVAVGMFFARHRIAGLLARPRPDTPPATAGLIPVTRTDP